MQFEIDSSAIEKYGHTLAKIHRSALPTAVRATLNGAAFDVKKNTLLSSAKKTFTERQKNFIKANSRVDPATGWDIGKMEAIVGMSEQGLSGENNYSVKDLEQQEHGGKINKKAFIPMRGARTGRSDKKTVRAAARLSKIGTNSFTHLNRGSAKSRSQQFIRAAIYAVSKGDGYVLGHRTKGGGRTLWKIDSISINRGTKKMKLKATPLYNVMAGRSVRISKPTHFMREAAEKSAKQMPKIFNHEAERQIKKFTSV